MLSMQKEKEKEVKADAHIENKRAKGRTLHHKPHVQLLAEKYIELVASNNSKVL